MGICFEDDKKRKNTWGNNNPNQNGQVNGENNEHNNDEDYIKKKREEYFQSNEFKKKHIFNNE